MSILLHLFIIQIVVLRIEIFNEDGNVYRNENTLFVDADDHGEDSFIFSLKEVRERCMRLSGLEKDTNLAVKFDMSLSLERHSNTCFEFILTEDFKYKIYSNGLCLDTGIFNRLFLNKCSRRNTQKWSIRYVN